MLREGSESSNELSLVLCRAFFLSRMSTIKKPNSFRQPINSFLSILRGCLLKYIQDFELDCITPVGTKTSLRFSYPSIDFQNLLIFVWSFLWRLSVCLLCKNIASFTRICTQNLDFVKTLESIHTDDHEDEPFLWSAKIRVDLWTALESDYEMFVAFL